MAKAYKDRFFLIRLARDEKKVRTAFVIIVGILLFILANNAYLTILSIKKDQAASPAVPTASATNMPTAAPTALPTNPVAPIQSSGASSQEPAVKEIFIPFGSGQSQAATWTNVPGLTAQIDFGKYQNIKEIHFEATVGIPTQNQSASVQLFNVTDGHAVWYSPITLTDGQFISSSPIIYDVGPKVYQVQMMTSLQYVANLYSSRLHIILK